MAVQQSLAFPKHQTMTVNCSIVTDRWDGMTAKVVKLFRSCKVLYYTLNKFNELDTDSY